MATIKVLIVEDSEVVASVLKDALESDRRVRVVGVAANGRQAVEMLPGLSPDLVTLDVWMPVMDGFETVEWIMAHQPTPILVITSSRLKEDVQISLRMLAAGALDVIEKPSMSDEGQWKKRQAELSAKVRLLSTVRVITHVRGRATAQAVSKAAEPTTSTGSAVEIAPAFTRPTLPDKPPLTSRPRLRPLKDERDFYFFPAKPRYRAVALASSTGGPAALLKILQKLPPNLPSPVFVVQHISEGFTQGLLDWLQREARLKLKISRDNELPGPGEVLIAPDRRNMMVQPNLKIWTATEPDSILCPNADSLMYSLAEVYGPRAIGVVLTGMGNDGAMGLRAMYEAGGYTIAQNETSSLIYGMPKAAVEAGGVREVLALENISTRLIELLQQPENLVFGKKE